MYVGICVSYVFSGVRCSLLLDTVSQRDDFSLIQARSLAASRPGNSLIFTLHSAVLINSQGFYVASRDLNSGPPVHAVSGPSPRNTQCFVLFWNVSQKLKQERANSSTSTFQKSTICSFYPASKPLWLRIPTWVFNPNRRWEPVRSALLLPFVLWYPLQHLYFGNIQRSGKLCFKNAMLKLNHHQYFASVSPLPPSLHLRTRILYIYVIMLFP